MAIEWAGADNHYERIGDQQEYWATWQDGEHERRVRQRPIRDDETRCNTRHPDSGLSCPSSRVMTGRTSSTRPMLPIS